MKVSELIKALKLMPKDLDVYAVCDHGQQPELAFLPSIQYFDDESENYTDDELEAEEYGYAIKGVLL